MFEWQVVKNKTKGTLPSNTEDYRQPMKLETITWVCTVVVVVPEKEAVKSLIR